MKTRPQPKVRKVYQFLSLKCLQKIELELRFCVLNTAPFLHGPAILLGIE